MNILTLKSLIFVIIASILVAGCSAFEDPAQRATENAEGTAIAATISVVDIQIETMVSLQQTADSSANYSTQLTAVSGERNRLQTQVAANSGGAVISGAPTQISAPGSTPSTVDGGAPAGAVPSPTNANAANNNNSPDGSRYINPVTASGVNNDFCAIDALTLFDSATLESIFFVVIAQSIPSNVEYSLLVTTQDGRTVSRDVGFWTSDNFYESTCIYYEMDTVNIPDFAPGVYVVELLANEQSVASASFTIN